MYKILPSQQGPVVLTDENEIIFLFQYANLMEVYYEDNELLDKLKDFVAEKLREYVEIEIKALKDANTPGQGLLQNYINSIHNLKEFQYNAMPQLKSQDGR